jgi:hypothetical protein
MAIFKYSVIRALVRPLTMSLFIPKFCLLTAKTPDEKGAEHPIFKVFCNHPKSIIITNQGIERTQSFTKPLILKNNGSLSLIEILSLSLENIKVEVIS